MSMWGIFEHNSLEILIIFQTTKTRNLRRHPWLITSYIFSRVVCRTQPKSSFVRCQRFAPVSESEPPKWKHTKSWASWQFQSELSHAHSGVRESSHGWRGDSLRCVSNLGLTILLSDTQVIDLTRPPGPEWTEVPPALQHSSHFHRGQLVVTQQKVTLKDVF